MSDSLTILDQQLQRLLSDMESSRVTIRNKAFEELADMLYQRIDDINDMFNILGSQCQTSWTDMWRGACNGLQRHFEKLQSSSAVDNKTQLYEQLLASVCENANKFNDNIPRDKIFEECCNNLRDDTKTLRFGSIYLRILDKQIFHSTTALGGITAKDWWEMLSVISRLFAVEQIPDNLIASAMFNAVDVGLKYFSIGHNQMDLHKLLSLFKRIFENNVRPSTHSELIKVSYLIVKETCFLRKEETIEYLVLLPKVINKFYTSQTNEEIKIYVYKTLHLLLILQQENENNRDPIQWNELLLDCMDKVESGINFLDRKIRIHTAELKTNGIFIEFAGTTAINALWNQTFVQNLHQPDDSNPPEKRQRLSSGFQYLIDRVNTDDTDQTKCTLSFRWLQVIAAALRQRPQLLEFSDYLSLLKVLSKCQQNIYQADQMNAFYQLIKAIIESVNQQQDFNNTPDVTSDDKQKVRDEWHTISENVVKGTTNTTKFCKENLNLLALLISYGKYKSTGGFITSIFESIFSFSTVKTNETLRLLVLILIHFNINTLENSFEWTQKIIEYLFPSSIVSSRALLTFQSKPDNSLVAAVVVLTCLSKGKLKKPIADKWTEQILNDNFTQMQCEETQLYTDTINEIIRLFAIKDLKQPMIDITEFTPDTELIDLPKKAECVIDEQIFGVFTEALTRKISDISAKAETQNNVLNTLISYINTCELTAETLKLFIETCSVDKTSICSFQCVKKIGLIFQETEKLFGKIKSDEFSDKLELELLEELQRLFDDKFHKAIAVIIRNFDLTSCLTWVKSSLILSTVFKGSLSKTSAMDLTKLSIEHKKHHAAFKVVSLYLIFQGKNTDMIERLLKCDGPKGTFIDNNPQHLTDVSLFLDCAQHLVKTRRRSPILSEFVTVNLSEIAQAQHKNPEVVSKVNNLLPNLCGMISTQNDSDMILDAASLLCSFVKQSINRYSTELICALLDNVKYFKRYFPFEYRLKIQNRTIYSWIPEFINRKCYKTQITAAKQVVFTVHRDWIHKTILKFASVDQIDGLEKFQVEFMKMFEFNESKRTDPTVLLQLFLFCLDKSYCISDTAVQSLLDIFYHTDCEIASLGQILPAFPNVSQHFDGRVIDIVSYWLGKQYQIDKFPWCFLSNIDNYEKFSCKYYKHVATSLLVVDINRIEVFAQAVDSNETELLLTIASEASAGVAMMSVKCPDRLQEAKNAFSRVMKEKGIQARILAGFSVTMQLIIENMVDDVKANTLFGMDFHVYKLNSSLSYSDYIKCSELILHKMLKQPQYSSLILFALQNEPYFVYEIMVSAEFHIKQSTIPEKKLQYLFHYVFIFEEIRQKLLELDRTMQNFFFNDVIHTICNLINSDTDADILEPCLQYFNKFCRTNYKLGQEIFSENLTFIIETLLNKLKRVECSETQTSIIDIINLFLITWKDTFSDVISSLAGIIPNFENLASQTGAQLPKIQSNTNTLIFEIQQFINTKLITDQSLSSLHTALGQRKNELIELYEKASTINFVEDCVECPLHRFINKLLRIARGNDEKKAILAGQCLGEIGAYNLSTVALVSRHELQNYEAITAYHLCYKELYRIVIENLPNALVGDVEIKSAASGIAYKIFQTNQGREIANNNPRFRVFLSNKPVTLNFCHGYPSGIQYLKDMFIGDDELKNYKLWMTTVVTRFLLTIGDIEIRELVFRDLTFAEEIFPALVKLFTTNSATETDSQIEAAVNEEVNKFFEVLLNRIDRGIETDKSVVKAMLSFLEYHRVQHQYFSNEKLVPQKIKIENYYAVVKAAHYCQSYFIALLYGELSQFEPLPKYPSFIDTVKEDKMMSGLLREAYKFVGATDFEQFFIDPMTEREHYLNSNAAWTRILLEQSAKRNPNVSHTLHELGLHNLTGKVCTKTDSYFYECAWRMNQWDIISDTTSQDHPNPFETFHYEALKNLHNNDPVNVASMVNEARATVINILKNTSVECPQSLYKIFNMFERLQQIEDFCKVRFERQDHGIMMDKWRQTDRLPIANFKLEELKSAQRICLLKEAGVVAGRSWSPKCIEEIISNLIQVSSATKDDSTTIRYISQLKTLKPAAHNYGKALIADARLMMNEGAEQMTEVLLGEAIKSKDPYVKMVAYRKMGEFKSESYVTEPENIFQKYFVKSVHSLENYARGHNALENMRKGIFDDTEVGRCLRENICIYKAVALFYDKEYTNLLNFMKSPTYDEEKRNLQRVVHSMEVLNNEKKLSDENRKQIRELEKLRDDGERQKQRLETDCTNYAVQSIMFYIKHCKCSPEIDNLNMYRLTTIWLNNPCNPNIKAVINCPQKGLLSLPSHLFLKLVPQLSARLVNKFETYTDKLIYEILKKCCIDHPHHSIIHLFALANNATQATSQVVQKNTPRTDGAIALLIELKKKVPKLKLIIKELRNMTELMIKFSDIQLGERNKARTIDVTKHKTSNNDQRNLITQLLSSEFPNIQFPTIPLRVSTDCKYEDKITAVKKFDSIMRMMVGLSAPKTIKAHCSNGATHLFLLKGKDDLRQDAVMQQVFDVVNIFLQQDSEAHNRKLRIRTYKVVPFSHQAGILEFCSNTEPIGPLIYRLHKIYRPFGFEPSEAREQICNARQQGDDKRLSEFKAVCSKLTPVFYQYFYNQFPSPGVWYERKTMYTNSMATNSMVGYILGIGDRHVQNILIDSKSAEMVHIDFGIAFDRGKKLPTPETIPFRLTRELITAMGITGYNGLFRKSAETTLQVLKDNQTTIMAILEVLVHDPLYSWELTNEKIEKTQQASTFVSTFKTGEHDETPKGGRNLAAEQVLNQILNKLNGRIINSSVQLSVKGVVESLIEQAIDDKNLCRLFHGWQAFL